MDKKKMTMDEAYTCPRCGGQYVTVGEMEQIFDDARSEDISCMKCGSSWTVFYKMSDFKTKVLNITTDEIQEDTTTARVVVNNDGELELGNVLEAIVESAGHGESGETADCHVVGEDGVKPGLVEEV